MADQQVSSHEGACISAESEVALTELRSLASELEGKLEAAREVEHRRKATEAQLSRENQQLQRERRQQQPSSSRNSSSSNSKNNSNKSRNSNGSSDSSSNRSKRSNKSTGKKQQPATGHVATTNCSKKTTEGSKKSSDTSRR